MIEAFRVWLLRRRLDRIAASLGYPTGGSAGDS